MREDSFLLKDAIDTTIEVTVRYPGGHGEAAGRVRHIPETPALWIGNHCFPMDVKVTVVRFANRAYPSYTIDTTNQ